jgi:ribosomal protein L20
MKCEQLDKINIEWRLHKVRKRDGKIQWVHKINTHTAQEQDIKYSHAEIYDLDKPQKRLDCDSMSPHVSEENTASTLETLFI